MAGSLWQAARDDRETTTLSEGRLAYRARLEASGLIARLTDQRHNGPMRGAAQRLLRSRLPAYWYERRPNFGDVIAPVIIRELFADRLQVVHPHYDGKILTCGSILNLALRPGDVVWGSGAIRPEPLDGSQARFLAVRGPLTRSLIRGDVPEVYGDPGSLMPEIYTPRPQRRYDVGVVPHIFDRAIMQAPDGVPVIDLGTRDWRRVVDQIAACNVVVSSSLHGIVVAETYGIPAVWVQPSDRLIGGEFKFRDYYGATGRDGTLHDWRSGLSALADLAVLPPRIDTHPLANAWAEGWR